MDIFVEKDDDDEDNVLHQPMRAYNVSSLDNIKLPDLVLNDNSDASECDEELELEPLIFHPVLDKPVISHAPVLDKPVVLHPPILDEAPGVPSSTYEGNCEHDIQLTTLTAANLAEMELDNAILSLVPSHSLTTVSANQDLSGLSDSNSSSSSLLGKLEETMATLRMESEQENGQIQENLTELQLKSKSVPDSNIEPTTIKVDLRVGQMPTHRCVVERYGRSEFSTIEEDDDYDDSRRKLKRESELVLLNKGKLDKSNVCLNGHTMEGASVSGKEASPSLSKDSVLSLNDSVDSMLENVNRIMCRGADKPAIAEKTQTSDESCEDYVEKSVFYGQKTGKESCISPMSCSAGTEEHYDKAGIVSRSESSINLEMNTQLVDWSDVLPTKCNDTSLNESDQVKCDIKEEISDSIFTNVFFSTAMLSENNKAKTTTITYSKPKKNILNVGEKKLPHTTGKTKANSKSNKINVSNNKSKREERNSDNKKLPDEKESLIVNRVGDKHESTKNTCSLYVGNASHCNGNLEVFDNFKEHKKNIKNCHVENGELSPKLSTEKLNRKLKYSNEKTIDTVINNKLKDNKKEDMSKRECLACHINNPVLETPMKHDESVCVNNNHVIDFNKKGLQKVNKNAHTTNILNLRDRNRTNPAKEIENDSNNFEGVGNCTGSNKENSIEESNSNSGVDDLSTATPQLPVVATKNSKNRKKKKSKKVVHEKNTELIDEPDSHVNYVQKKGIGIPESFWKELMPGGKETVLYDEVTSFEQSYVVVPETNKELLLLKVPLESPGVCKTNANDSINTLADQSSSDNYIGLVTLFIYLLQGSRRDISLPNLGIPFDVVSLQQAHLDSELLLIVGIVENKNTCHQKTKRSKLGTAFFHAVSQFLNTNDLDKIISKIWEHTEADISRIQDHVPYSISHIWRQVEMTGANQCSIPGKGKLSTFINISPDINALQRIYNLYPSLFVHSEEKSVLPEEYNWFHPGSVKQEYTCITVENVTAISPRHVSELLKRLRKESVEICGLRILYSNKDNCLYTPLLSICVNEFNAATTTEGKLLLSDCDELKELAISFNTQENISVIMNGSPLLKYTINSQRSHRQVVRMFGPHYNDACDMKTTLTELKSANKVSNNKNDKKKWAVGSCRELSLLNNCISSSVLYINELVPSAFISFVISMALKKGLQLKMIYRTCCSLSQLGASEDKVDGFTHSDSEKRKSHTNMMSCILMLFSGKSVLFRLLGLVCKLTDILNNPLTGETLLPWMADNMIKFTRSHNVANESCKLSYSSKDYFGVLHFNDQIRELLSKSFKLPKQHIVEDLYSILSEVQINFMKPEVNLMALLFYGDDILKDFPTLLRGIFSGCTFQCLNSWRESTCNKTWLCSPGSDSVKHRPAIEFLGAKYITSISKLQASNLVISEHYTAQWETEVSKMVGSKAVLMMVKVLDRRTANQVTESISKYSLSSKFDLMTTNYIIHSDTEYVFRLMFQYFDLNELHGDQLKDETQIPTFCLPDNHVVFTGLDNVDTSLDCQLLVKKKLPEKDWENILPSSDVPTTSYVYEFTPPKSMNFPLQMLLYSERSYAGISFEYLPHNIHSIFKALARMHRMEFQIAALKFPSYNTTDGTCHVCAVLLRQDSVFVLNKMVPELEINFPKLKFTMTSTVHDVNAFIECIFRSSSKVGGIFHCNYFALLYELNFEKEECFENRENREVEWNPQKCNESDMWHTKKENTPLSITSSIVSSTDEVSVIILSQPLLCGRYLGRKLPENCLFPAVLHVFESALYRIIAAKTTMLSTEGAKEIVGVYGVDGKKKSSMVRLLSQEGGPFVVLVLVGSCILANFWLTMVWKLDNDDAVNALRQHTLVPTTKKQVESLLVCLFDKVVQNTKVELKTRLS